MWRTNDLFLEHRMTSNKEAWVENHPIACKALRGDQVPGRRTCTVYRTHPNLERDPNLLFDPLHDPQLRCPLIRSAINRVARGTLTHHAVYGTPRDFDIVTTITIAGLDGSSGILAVSNHFD